ncbi:hypothetical protein NL676_031412 [Syzygium grande]|nr:hypothetical protein NL676_031412 [Syzygium grande]
MLRLLSSWFAKGPKFPREETTSRQCVRWRMTRSNSRWTKTRLAKPFSSSTSNFRRCPRNVPLPQKLRLQM